MYDGTFALQTHYYYASLLEDWDQRSSDARSVKAHAAKAGLRPSRGIEFQFPCPHVYTGPLMFRIGNDSIEG